MDPGNGRLEYGLRFQGDLSDDDFMLGMMHRVGTDHREFSLENVSMDPNGDVEVYATSDGDSLVIANHGESAVSAKVLLRCSRDVGQAVQEVTVKPGEKMTVTANWDDLTDELEISTEAIEESDEASFILMIGSAVLIIAALVLFVRFRKRREGAP
jgi:hypothetical protein